MDDIEELLQNAAMIHLAAIKISVSGAMSKICQILCQAVRQLIIANES
jgi:hypothetical protein